MNFKKDRKLKSIATIILLVSFSIFIFNIIYSNNVVNRLSSDQTNYISGTQSDAVNHITSTKFPNNNFSAQLLFSVKNHNQNIYSSNFRNSVINSLRHLSGLVNYASYYTTNNNQLNSINARQTIVNVNLSGSPSTQYKNLLNFKNQISSPYYTVNIGGLMVIQQEATIQVKNDLKLAEMLSLPILALVLAIVFRSVLAAIIPILLGVFSIFGGLSILRVLASYTNIDQYSIDVITLLGLGLSVDYSLLIISRFREEINNNNSISSAVKTTILTAGKTIVFSGSIVIVCLLSLSFFPITLIRSIAFGGASAVLIAILGALLIVPSILALLGPNIKNI